MEKGNETTGFLIVSETDGAASTEKTGRLEKGEILSEHFEILFCHSQKASSVF